MSVVRVVRARRCMREAAKSYSRVAVTFERTVGVRDAGVGGVVDGVLSYSKLPPQWCSSGGGAGAGVLLANRNNRGKIGIRECALSDERPRLDCAGVDWRLKRKGAGMRARWEGYCGTAKFSSVWQGAVQCIAAQHTSFDVCQTSESLWTNPACWVGVG